MAKLHLNLQFFPGVFQPAAVSHINERRAPGALKLRRAPTLYIDGKCHFFQETRHLPSRRYGALYHRQENFGTAKKKKWR